MSRREGGSEGRVWRRGLLRGLLTFSDVWWVLARRGKKGLSNVPEKLRGT